MAIVLKYGAPGPILAAGYAAGQGRRQQRQQDDALKFWEQQQQQGFQAKQAELGREFQAGQAKLGRDFQAQQQEALLDFRAFENELGRGFAAEEGRLDRELRLDLERRREDGDTLEGIRKGALELPPAADRKLKELEAGRVEALKLEPDQQAEFMERYEAEKRALLGMAQPKAEPSIGEDFDKNVMERDGTLYQRGKDGGFDVLREKPEDQQGKAMGEFAKSFRGKTKPQEAGSLDAPQPYSAEDIAQAWKVEQEAIGRMGGQSQEAQGPPPGTMTQEEGRSFWISPEGQREEVFPKNSPASGWKGALIYDDDTVWRVTEEGYVPQGKWHAQEQAQEQAQPPRTDGRGGALAIQRQPEQGANISPDEFSKQWATLGEGQSIRGPDGKLYTKKRP